LSAERTIGVGADDLRDSIEDPQEIAAVSTPARTALM